MSGERFLLDTSYIQAVFSTNDALHERARAVLPRVRDAKEVLVTQAVLLEAGNALSKVGSRKIVAAFIRQCCETPNTRIVPVDEALFQRALALFEARPDKEWSLVDCVSFVVMQDEGLYLAVTGDHHFEQAGFLPILAKGNQQL